MQNPRNLALKMETTHVCKPIRHIVLLEDRSFAPLKLFGVGVAKCDNFNHSNIL